MTEIPSKNIAFPFMNSSQKNPPQSIFTLPKRYHFEMLSPRYFTNISTPLKQGFDIIYSGLIRLISIGPFLLPRLCCM